MFDRGVIKALAILGAAGAVWGVSVVLLIRSILADLARIP